MTEHGTEGGPSIISRLTHDRGAVYSLVRYVVIGSLVAAMNLGTFQALTLAGRPLVLATSIGYLLGVVSHFTLNKYLNFRDVRRSGVAQAQTYLVVVVLSYALTLAIVTSLSRAGMRPIVANVISAIVNVPFGFFCHRFLTFGPGIRATVARLMSTSSK